MDKKLTFTARYPEVDSLAIQKKYYMNGHIRPDVPDSMLQIQWVIFYIFKKHTTNKKIIKKIKNSP